MTSLFLKEFRTKLSELNNTVSHYIFIWEQFHEDHKNTLKSKAEELVTTAFPANKNSQQFNVKLGTLTSTDIKTYNLILKSLFLFAYTEFEIYLKSIYEFSRKINPSLPTLSLREKMPDEVLNLLNIDIETTLEREEILTFDYIRLRRNRFVHSAGETKGDLADLIRNKGHLLQKFWNKKLKNGMFGIDFQSSSTELFTNEELFDLINIWRALVGKIDTLICSQMNRKELILQLKRDFSTNNKLKIKAWSNERKSDKFCQYCNFLFNLSLKSEEITNLDFSDVA